MLFSNQLLQVSVSLNYHTTYFFCVMSHFSSVSVDIFTHITTAPLTSYLLPLIITARQRLITAPHVPNNRIKDA